MKVRNCRNVKFNGQFVLNNLSALRKTYKFKSGVLTLISVANRDGLKCDTCQNDKIHFELHPEYGMAMYAGTVRMTKDHDLLNSLEGSDGVHNQHLLCETCNTLRGNRFAEYKEFKDWYNSVLEKGLNPNTVINKVKRNFSYMDFHKNRYTASDMKNLMVSVDVMPVEVKNSLTEHFLIHQSFKAVKSMYGFHTLLSFSAKAWDDYLNELMVTIIKTRIKQDIQLGNTIFNVYKYKNSKKSIETFFIHLNKSIKDEYKNIKSTVQSGNVKKEVQEVLNKHEQSFKVIPMRPNFFQRLKNAFQVLVAA